MPADDQSADEHSGRKMRTDGCLAARGTVLCRDFEKAIRINLKGSHELSLATRHGRDPSKLELAKQAIVTTLSPLSFVTVTSRKTSEPTDNQQKKAYTGNVTVV